MDTKPNHSPTRCLTGLTAVVLATVAILCPGSILAQTTYTFTPTAIGTYGWTMAGNWSGGVPVTGTATTVAFFSDTTTALGNGAFVINTDPATFTLNTLTLNGKGAAATAATTVAIGTAANTWTFDGTSPTVNLNGMAGTKGLTFTINPKITLNANLTVAGSGTSGGTTFASAISGAYGISNASSSTLILTGVNTYTGPTTISAGTLTIGGAGQLGGGTYAGNITNNGAFNYGSSAAETLSGVVSGSGSLTNSSYGTLTLNSANTYSGGTVLNGGTTSVGNATALGTGLVAINSGATLVGGTVTVANPFTLNGGKLRNLSNNKTFTLSGGVTLAADSLLNLKYHDTTEIIDIITTKITGSYGFTLTDENVLGGTAGSPVMRLSAAGSDYAGNTTITSGTLRMNAANALPYGAGKGNIVLNGSSTTTGQGTIVAGTLDLNGNGTSINGLSGTTGTQLGTVLNNAASTAATLTVGNGGATSTFSGVIANGTSTLALTKTGVGAITLAGANTFSGVTTINQGQLIGAVGGSCVNSAVSVAATSGNAATMGISITDNTKQWTCSSLTVNNAGISSSLDFSFGSVVPSTSVAPLNVTGTAAFTTTPAVTVEVLVGSIIAGNSYPLMAWGSTSGTVPTAVAVTVGGRSSVTAHLTVVSSKLNLVIDTIASTEPLSWATGSGTWDVSNSGNVVWKDNTSATTYYQAGDSVVFDNMVGSGGTVTLNTTVSPPSVVVNNPTADYTISGSGGIAGTTGLTKSGAGALTLPTANTYSGGTTLNAGTLNFNNAAAIGATASTLTISGVSTLGNTSGAAVTLTNNNAQNWNADFTFTNSGSANNVNLGTGAVTLGGNRQVTVSSADGSASLTVGGAIGDGGLGYSLTKAGTAALTLSGVNTYSGGTTISGGTITAQGSRPLGMGSVLVNNLAIIQSDSSATWGNAFTVSGGKIRHLGASSKTITMSGGVNLTANSLFNIKYHDSTALIDIATNPITGSFGFTLTDENATGGIAGSPVLRLSVGTNTYAGNTTIASGTLRMNSLNALPFGAGKGNVVLNGMAAAPVGTLDLNGYNTSINGLSGTNSTVLGTVLNNAASTAATLTIGNGDTNSTFSGIIADGTSQLALAKTGAGTFTLAGVNTYTGATTVSNGTLLVNGSLAAGSAVTVLTGAMLGGTGTIGGSVTLNSGAVVMLTNGSPLSISGVLIANGNVAQLNLSNNVPIGSYTLATYNPAGSSGLFNSTPTIVTGSLAVGTAASIVTSSGSVMLQVTAAIATTTTTLNTSVSPSTYGQSVTFMATVKTNGVTVANVTNNYVFKLDGISVATNAVASGMAAYTTTGLMVATHTVSAEYQGDVNYTPSTNSLSQIVSQTPLVITANDINQSYNGMAFSGGAGVTYAGYVNGETNTILGGTLSYGGTSQGAINAGTYNIVPSGMTATNYAIIYTNGTLTIIKAITFVGAFSSENPSGYRDNVTYTATLPSDATGSVVFSSTNGTFSTNSFSGGTATSLSITNLPRGTNVITVTYDGNSNYLASTTNLNQIVTNHPPVTGNVVYIRNAGIASLRILISDLLTNVTDADGDVISLVGIGTSTNVITVTTVGTNYLYYYNTNNVNDQFSYTVTDGFGGTNTGLVSIVVSNAATGQITGQFTSFTGNVANLTFHGIPNYSYITERSTNLTDWVDVVTNSAATNGVISVTDSFGDLGNVPPASAYYRLKWQP